MTVELKTVGGIYRHGKIDLLENPDELDETRVIVTFLPEGSINIAERGIDETQAANLRSRLATFAEDWERPEMGAYDAL